MIDNETIQGIDLQPYKDQVEGYILRKEMVMAENYTVEDVLIVGLRTLKREKAWQEKHGSSNQKEKIAKLEAQVKALGGNPTEEVEEEEETTETEE